MSKSILIAADKEDARVMMKVLVQMSGYEAVVAEHGQEAIEKAKEHLPSLIFMDLSMPVMDGITATETLRNCSKFAEVPIIALTAYGDLRGQEALQAGCNEVIKKPIDFGHLQPILEKYLR
jgi:CheY-like chemotaxis protein